MNRNSVLQQNSFVEFIPFQQYYYDFSVEYIPTTYVCWNQSENLIEIDDQELLRYALKSSAYSFLNDSEEDIYSVNDGKLL